jgi:hypothetical protein
VRKRLGFYSRCFPGIGSVGSLVAGFPASQHGAPGAVMLGADVCVAVGLLLFRRIIPLPAEETGRG